MVHSRSDGSAVVRSAPVRYGEAPRLDEMKKRMDTLQAKIEAAAEAVMRLAIIV